MSKPYVLCTAFEGFKGVPSYLLQLISKHFGVVWLKDLEDNKDAIGKDVVAIISTHGQPQITRGLLEKLPSLKLVAVVGAGYNHVDLEMVHSFGATVSNTPYVLDDSTADMGMALLLAAGRNLCEDFKLAVSPETTQFPMNQVSQDVSHTTLGIVGMGRIGYKVAERAKGFSMTTLYHNRNRRSVEDEAAVSATYYERLNDMLPLCDYVMISAKLTPETQNMMGAEQFKLMKNTSVLVNISRGKTVDHDALVHALSSGQIHFAALDVTEPEPLPRDHPLLKMSNVIITPHVGSATLKTRKRMMQKAIDNVLAVIEGRQLPSEVPK